MAKDVLQEIQEHYANAGHFYILDSCGCLLVAFYDTEDMVNDRLMRQEVANHAFEGRTLQHCEKGQLPPLNCAVHEADYQARKAARAVEV